MLLKQIQESVIHTLRLPLPKHGHVAGSPWVVDRFETFFETVDFPMFVLIN